MWDSNYFRLIQCPVHNLRSNICSFLTAIIIIYKFEKFPMPHFCYANENCRNQISYGIRVRPHHRMNQKSSYVFMIHDNYHTASLALIVLQWFIYIVMMFIVIPTLIGSLWSFTLNLFTPCVMPLCT